MAARLACIVALMTSLGPALAGAQEAAPGLDALTVTPTSGRGLTFTLPQPEVPSHLAFDLGLSPSVALDPVVSTVDVDAFDDDDDEAVLTVMPYRAQVELSAALGLFEYLELGVVLPLVIADVVPDFQDPELRGEAETVAALGNIRLDFKIPLVRGDVALTARGAFQLPTGDADNLLGTDYWTLMPSLVFAYTSGAFRIGAELGYRFRQRRVLGENELNDEVQFTAGLSYELSPGFAVLAELNARPGFFGDEFDSPFELPVEAGAGLRFDASPSFRMEVGAGTGVIAGFGTPSLRLFASLRYRFEPEPCEHGPEDADGFDDDDFCAELDNDQDGISDAADTCPNDAEDLDGFMDEDGCPDVDNDADGILDAADECPNDSEDRDGFRDSDGCPEPDNDEDGLLDGLDGCPMEPEDLDQFEDADGCPEPGPIAPTVTVTESRIFTSDRIYFEFDADTIRAVSRPVLDEVAETIKRLSRSQRVRVDGYTDSEGDSEYNLDLSYRRARAIVEYLVGRGVRRDRLDFRGHGSETPVAPNDSPEGRALNRRVELSILSED